MPDRDGWEIQPTYRPRIWHADCDTHVPNNAKSKREHLTACRRLKREAAAKAERDRQKAATDRLRALNRERALARSVLGDS